VLSEMFSRRGFGFCERNTNPRTSFFSSAVSSISRSGLWASVCALQRSSSACSRSSSAVFCFFMSLATRSSRFSIWLRSLTISSISTLPMSRSGSIGPTWGCVVLEGAQHVDDRVHIAQAGEEGVS